MSIQKYIQSVCMVLGLILVVSPCWGLPQKVIIDTDPGVDDMIALALALKSPELDVLGITTTFGNVTTRQANQNVLALVEHFGESVPVYPGALKPCEHPPRPPADFVHGQDGLGNIGLKAKTSRLNTKPAYQFIVETIRQYPHEVTLLALGAQTNLAYALNLDPEIAQLAKKVVVMGGVFQSKGNINDYVEANIYSDPMAAKRVASASWPITYVGLDVTTQVYLEEALLKEIQASNPKLGDLLVSASQFYFDYHQNRYGYHRKSYLHDPSAVIFLTNPEFFTTTPTHVEVQTEGEREGQMLMVSKDDPSHIEFCSNVDPKRVLSRLKTTLVN